MTCEFACSKVKQMLQGQKMCVLPYVGATATFRGSIYMTIFPYNIFLIFSFIGKLIFEDLI